jgi:hypothetical protein
MAEGLLTILRKNAREEVQVFVADDHGQMKVVLREFFEVPEGDKFQGHDGVAPPGSPRWGLCRRPPGTSASLPQEAGRRTTSSLKCIMGAHAIEARNVLIEQTELTAEVQELEGALKLEAAKNANAA